MSGQAATAGVHKGARRVQSPCPFSPAARSGGLPARDSAPSPGPSPPPAFYKSHAGPGRFGRAAPAVAGQQPVCTGRSRFTWLSAPVSILYAAPFAFRLRPPPLRPRRARPTATNDPRGASQTIGLGRWRLGLGRDRVDMAHLRVDSTPRTDRSQSDRTPHHCTGARRPSSSSARRAAPLVGSTRGRTSKSRRRQEKGRAPAPRSER